MFHQATIVGVVGAGAMGRGIAQVAATAGHTVVRQPDGSFLADARASLDDLSAIVGPEFDVAEVAKEVDTLAGYIATRIGRVPVRGELVPGPGRYEIEVLDADPRRVKKLKIYLSTDRNGGNHKAAPRASAGQPLPPTTPTTDLPVNRDAAVKLSPDDAPSKGTPRP